ncbi:amino acid adenylation domain-containing protein [Paraburkholderia fungorum]|uniref:non-ribosomal peptide synthetase n=1 Tax=Paraburkholderia fungorum TaxID=134537 RepID=UPI0038BA8B60
MNDFAEQMDTDGVALSPAQREVLTARDVTANAEGGRDAPAVLGVSLRGPFDDARLADAFASVCARHEITQTAFRHVPGYVQPRQFPYALAVPSIERVECSPATLADAGRDAITRISPTLGASALCHEDAHPLRAVLLRADADTARLVLIASRAAADDASLAALLRATVDAYALRDVPEADDEPVQYTQFVEWRDELSRDDDAPAAAEYWRAYAADVAAQTQGAASLPYRRRVAAEGARKRAAQPLAVELDATSRDALYDVFTRDHELSADVIAQAAWWVVLARVSGASAWDGGWQHDCRRDYDMLRAGIGAYQQVLPVLLRCAPEDRFIDVARALQTTLATHRRWQEYAASHSALLTASAKRVSFVQADPAVTVAIGGAGVSTLSAEIDALNGPLPDCELGLQADIDADGRIVRVALHYADDVYPRDAMTVLLDQYVNVLTALPSLAAQRKDRIADLPLTNAESERALLDWRGASLDVSGAHAQCVSTVGERIAHWATRTPDAPALVGDEAALSYGELHARVARLASQLAAIGAPRGTPIALAMPRCAAQVVALLAVMQAGAPYLPLDPAWPAARRRAIVAQAKPSLVLCLRDDYASLSPDDLANASYAVLDATSFEIALNPPIANAAAPHQPEAADAAYVLFTSGSTGQPKGVVIEHRQLLNYVAGVSATLGLAHVRRVALTSTVAADLGNTALFGALYNGACLVVANAHDTHDAAAFARFLRDQSIDCLKMTPSHLDALLDTRGAVVPRTLILGGEPVPRRLAEKVRAIDPACRIFNHYGPTETTIGVLVHEFGARTDGDSVLAHASADALALTTPLPNCHVYVLDAAQRLAPVGVLGEVFIGGAQVCRGYLDASGRSGANSANSAFIDDPFQPGERLYRSGDMARYLPGGGIQLAGRADDQIKLRGFRIELAEIEAALRAVPGVAQAVVRAFGDDAHRYLAAFITCDDPTVAETAIRVALAERLPEPMVPARVVVLAAMPRLPNGKIDRQALAEPGRALSGQSGAITETAPRTALETLLAQNLATLLERDSVGIHQNLFELGGDSLLVIRLASRVRDLLRIDVLPGLIFEHPNVAELARSLAALHGTPEVLERTAKLRLKLDAMDPAERAQIEERAREQMRVREQAAG